MREAEIGQPKLQIEWNDLKKNIEKLTIFIPNGGSVWGVPRNGLILSMFMQFYRNDIKVNYDKIPSAGDYIIDDIYDSGKTLEYYKEEGFLVGSIYWRENKENRRPDFMAQTIKDNSWLVLPWEYK